MSGETIFPRVIDATMRSDWRSCPHKFYRRHLQGLTRGWTDPSTGTSTTTPNVHLHFGSCIAHGLEVARKAYCAGASANTAVLDGCAALMQHWGTYEPLPARTRNEANKTLEACLMALHSYFREWPLDDDPVRIHSHNGTPCVEFSFALPIPGSRHPDTGEPILYCGRFDFIGDYEASTWGVDDKTTGGDPNNDYWRTQWKLRGQFSGYTWGAREYGMNLKGFIVRGIGILAHDVKCGWALAPRPGWMVDRWLRQLQDDVVQMVEQYKLYRHDFTSWAAAADSRYANSMPPIPIAHAFPQSFDHACADFGGCQFLDLCTSEHPSIWLDDYTVNRWNPLERSDT